MVFLIFIRHDYLEITMAITKKDIERLIEIQYKQMALLEKQKRNEEIAEQDKLTELEKQELDKLYLLHLKNNINTHPEFTKEQRLQCLEQIEPQTVVVNADDDNTDDMVADYNKQFKEGDKYKEGYAEPKTEGNKTSLTFPSQESALSFFQGQADKGQSFIIADKNNKVIAYANGDGKLCRPDGEEFKKGDPLVASDVDVDDFRIPRAPKPN